MKRLILYLACIMIGLLSGCQEEEVLIPDAYYTIVINQEDYQLGDSLCGKVVVKTEEMVEGVSIKKIDCRLGNIVMGTTENETECAFGMKLDDKPIGLHTLSVIIKCDAPDYDMTYFRYDMDIINIRQLLLIPKIVR